MNSLDALMDALRRLPGVGQKTAQRLAYYLVRCPREEADTLSKAIQLVRDTLRPCRTCHYLSDSDPCIICSDPARSAKVLCAVEDSLNVTMIERSDAFHGIYHVIGGVISPLRGIGPEELNLETLLSRVARGGIEEVILATSPTVEGMVTARYIESLLEPYPVKLSELARGLSIGTDLEFADDITLAMAIEARREVR
ncbi:MAG TPA: recombination mediator RecR [Thermoanaerobaculia bacterium]|nr:recombination mediator RecR [Thermoanaerobaculia bacterium]HUM30285.1 recombination mediator RecR [Thermoanaerobaculia bacterium]HXK68419.1 recombination mediator RecR [Thermoanaerobaculia bacterium]